MAVIKVVFRKNKLIEGVCADYRSDAAIAAIEETGWKDVKVVDVKKVETGLYDVKINHESTRFINAKNADEAIAKIKKTLKFPKSFQLLSTTKLYEKSDTSKNSDLR